MNHINANELETRGIAAIEQALSEARTDVAAGCVVRESAEAHLARLDASHDCVDQCGES